MNAYLLCHISQKEKNWSNFQNILRMHLETKSTCIWGGEKHTPNTAQYGCDGELHAY